jgi:hypothetical protein
MCEDTAGYANSQGYDCSSNLGFDCLNEALDTENWGYSLEESCPESCGLCESSGETWSAVPQPFSGETWSAVPQPFTGSQMPGYTSFGRLDTFYYETPTPFSTSATLNVIFVLVCDQVNRRSQLGAKCVIKNLPSDKKVTLKLLGWVTHDVAFASINPHDVDEQNPHGGTLEDTETHLADGSNPNRDGDGDEYEDRLRLRGIRGVCRCIRCVRRGRRHCRLDPRLTMMEIDMQDGHMTKILLGDAKIMRTPFDVGVGGSINYADTKALNRKCDIKAMVGSSKTTSKLHFAFHTRHSTLEPSATAPAETIIPDILGVPTVQSSKRSTVSLTGRPAAAEPSLARTAVPSTEGTTKVPTTNPDCVNDLGDETCNALHVSFSGFCAADVKRACARLSGTCYGTNAPSFAPTANPKFSPTAEPTNAELRESHTLDPNCLNAVLVDGMCDLLVKTLSDFCAADIDGARRRKCGTGCTTSSPTIGKVNPAVMLSAHPTLIPTATGRSVSSGLRMYIFPRGPLLAENTVYTSADVNLAVNLRRHLREMTITVRILPFNCFGGLAHILPFNGGVAQFVDRRTRGEVLAIKTTGGVESYKATDSSPSRAPTRRPTAASPTVVPTAAPNVVSTANPALSLCVGELGEAECLELVKEVHGFRLLEFESSFCLRTCGRCSSTLFGVSCLHSSYASDFASSSVSMGSSINVHSSCASACSSMRSFSSMGSMGSMDSTGSFSENTVYSLSSMGPFSWSNLYSSYASDWSSMGPSFSESGIFYSSHSSEWLSRATKAPTELPTNPLPTVHPTTERTTTDPTIYATVFSIYATAISLHLFVLNAKVWPARRHYGGTMAMAVLIAIALPGTDADNTDLAAHTTSKYNEHTREDDFAYAPCDATRLLPYAVDIGDCTAFLRHDATCTQTGLDGYTCFSKCQHGTLVDGRCFQAGGVVIDLATFNPNRYRGSTAGNPNAITLCGNGPEQAFSYVLAPGHGIAIGLTSTSFDSTHTLRHGGQFPGEVSVDCVDAPDESPLEFLNDGMEDVAVYFIVDASSSGEAGAFTVEWRFYTVGPDSTTVTTNLWPEPRTRQGRVLNADTPLTNSNIKTAAQLWVSNQASATTTYGLVSTWDLSQVTDLASCKWFEIS